MTASPISLTDLFTIQNMGMQPPPQYMGNSMGMPVSQMPQSTPMAGPQNVQMPPDVQHIQNVVNQYQQNQTGQDTNDFLKQILSQRLQPDLADASKSVLMSNQGGQYVSPDQVVANRVSTQLSPYSDALGLQQKQAETGLQNAQAGYYSSALQRAIAEKKFEYENDPQMALMRGLANYMNGPQPNNITSPSVDTTGVAMPPNINTPQQGNIPQRFNLNQNNTTQIPGFSLPGTMIGKMAGLTDMQIVPDGRGGLSAMPIPGAIKMENGAVMTIGPGGKPQTEIPVNPRAQGLFEQKLQDINDKIDQLHKLNGTVEEGGLANILNNKAVQLSATKSSLFGFGPGGQDFLQGTPQQSLRDDIQADVKQALPLYMQAFGITPGMERAASAQQMLLDAIGGAVGKSRQHLKANLANLSQTAGTGQLYNQLNQAQSPANTNGQPTPQDIVNELRNRGIVK